MLKNRKDKRCIGTVGALSVGLMVLVGLTSLPLTASGDDSGPILIGNSLPLTGPAPFAGKQYLDAREMAVDVVNKAGGIHDRQVELIVYDNACNPDQGASNAELLTSRDKVHLIIGNVCSGATMAAFDTIQETETPLVISGATSPVITEMMGIGGNEWAFRTALPDSFRGSVLAGHLIKDLGAKSIVLLAFNDDWGRGNGGFLEEFIPCMGAELVAVDYFEPERQDFMPLITKYKAMGPDALILIGGPTTGGAFWKQAHSVDLRDSVPLLSGFGGVVTSKAIEVAGVEATDGLISANSWAPDVPTQANKDFIKNFTAWTGGTPPTPDAARSYIGIQTALKAIEIAGTTNNHVLREVLEQIEVETMVGSIKFDLNHQAAHDLYIAKAMDGEVKLTDTISASTVQESLSICGG